MTKNRFYLALACYAIISALAAIKLEGPFRVAVWVFMGGLAVKTWLVTLRRDEEEQPRDGEE